MATELVFGTEIKPDDGLLRETFINKRNIKCKSCFNEFMSYDVKCFEYSKERVRVFCPRCKTENLILKVKVINVDE